MNSNAQALIEQVQRSLSQLAAASTQAAAVAAQLAVDLETLQELLPDGEVIVVPVPPFPDVPVPVDPQPEQPVDPSPVEPPPEAPGPTIAGSPRTLIGHRYGLPLFQAMIEGQPVRLHQVNQPGQADAFAYRGGNFEFDPLPGVELRPVPHSDWSGHAEPTASPRPAGYFRRFFPPENGAGPYYQQGSQPDEIDPNVPVVATPQPQPNALSTAGPWTSQTQPAQ